MRPNVEHLEPRNIPATINLGAATLHTDAGGAVVSATSAAAGMAPEIVAAADGESLKLLMRGQHWAASDGTRTFVSEDFGQHFAAAMALEADDAAAMFPAPPPAEQLEVKPELIPLLAASAEKATFDENALADLGADPGRQAVPGADGSGWRVWFAVQQEGGDFKVYHFSSGGVDQVWTLDSITTATSLTAAPGLFQLTTAL